MAVAAVAATAPTVAAVAALAAAATASLVATRPTMPPGTASSTACGTSWATCAPTKCAQPTVPGPGMSLPSASLPPNSEACIAACASGDSRDITLVE